MAIEIEEAINGVDELVASLQPTPFKDIHLNHEHIIKGEVLETGQYEGLALVQVLIRR